MTGAATAPAGRSRRRWVPWMLLGLILLLAGVLRAHHIAKDDFWLDEVYSVESAMGRGFAHRLLPANTIIEHPHSYTDPAQGAPWRGIWQTASDPVVGDIHPPLPYLILRGWCTIFSYSEAGARSLSLTASLIAILLLFLTARLLHGEAAALWACLIMAIASPQIAFGQEAKHYALLQMFALSAALAIVAIEKRGVTPVRWCALVLAVLAMLLTHYFSMGVIVALGLYASVGLRGRTRTATLGAIFFAGGIFAVAWLPHMFRQVNSQGEQMDYFLDGGEGFLGRWVEHLASIPFRLIGSPLPSAREVAYGASVMYVIPAALCVWGKRRDLLLWALWLPCVVGVVALADLLRHAWLMNLIRYSLAAGPAMYALLAALFSGMKPALRHGAPALIVLACAPFIASGWEGHPYRQRAAAEAIVELGHPGGVTIFSHPIPMLAYADFVMTMHYARQLPGPAVILTKPPDAQLLSQIRARGSAVVFVSTRANPADILPGAEVVTARFVQEGGIAFQVELPRPAATVPAQRVPSTVPQAGR